MVAHLRTRANTSIECWRVKGINVHIWTKYLDFIVQHSLSQLFTKSIYRRR